MGKIFISYARSESEPFAKRLYNDLTEHGIDVWWDRKAMQSRGRGFPQEIRTAITEVDRLLLVVGPKAMKSRYVKAEWKCADDPKICKGIIPILFEGGSKIIPRELQRQKLHYVDFSSEVSYEKALSELLRLLKFPVAPLGKLGGECEKLPPILLSRPKEITWLNKALIPSEPEDLYAKEKTVLIWGMGGVGKSVLARMFSEPCYTHRAFKDGISWLKFTQEGDFDALLMNAITQVAEGLKEKKLEKYKDPQSCLKNFKELLTKKNCLIVLDNVWDIKHIDAFEETMGPECRLLATIQDAELAMGRNQRLRELKLLSEKESLNFLAMWAGKKTWKQLPPEAKKIVERSGCLPFTLKLCGAMVSGPNPLDWNTLLDFCKKAKYKKIIELLPKPKQKEFENLYCCIEVSLDALGNEGEMGKQCVKNYRDLAVFPGGETVPESVILSLWEKTSSKPDKNELKLMAKKLCDKALLQLDWDLPPRQYEMHNLCTDYLRLLDKDGSNLKRLHGVLGKALLEWWQENKFKIRKKENIQQERYIMKNLFTHFYRAGLWYDLKKLLNDIEYLKKQQEPTRQYMFQKNFKLLLQDEKVSVYTLVEILEGVFNAISNELPLENEKADWLDSFAYWINSVEIKDAEKRSKLKKIAQTFDRKCGEVSHDLVKKKLKEGKNNWALRFAELRTWVYQRAGEKEDFEKCEEACRDAEETCLLQGMEDAYRYLGRAEFIRMRANCLSRLSRMEADKAKKAKYKADAERAYSHLDEVLAEGGGGAWLPSLNEWQVLEKTLEENSEKLLTPPSQKKSSEHTKFRANVVSNTHDCISAIHIIRFLEEHGGLVQWVHHKDFEAEDFTRENPLFTVLIGGPKSPGISPVESEKFYNADKEGWLRMYNGLEFTDECLELKEGKTRCYMLGGPSKINTLMAAYKFTKNPKIIKIIKKSKPFQ